MKMMFRDAIEIDEAAQGHVLDLDDEIVDLDPRLQGDAVLDDAADLQPVELNGRLGGRLPSGFATT